MAKFLIIKPKCSKYSECFNNYMMQHFPENEKHSQTKPEGGRISRSLSKVTVEGEGYGQACEILITVLYSM